MSTPTHLMTRSATLRRRTQSGTDIYGDATYSFTEEPVLCELQQDRVRELRDNRLVELSTWTLFLPAGVPTSGWDEVVIEGRTYTADGDPWDVRHPFSGEQLFSELKVRQMR